MNCEANGHHDGADGRSEIISKIVSVPEWKSISQTLASVMRSLKSMKRQVAGDVGRKGVLTPIIAPQNFFGFRASIYRHRVTAFRVAQVRIT